MAVAELVLHQGDSYTTTGQGPIPLTVTDAPSLVAAASITLDITRGDTVVVTAAGTLAAATYPAPQVVHVTLSALQTAALGLRSYGYHLWCVTSAGDTVTLGHGGPGSVSVTPRAT